MTQQEKQLLLKDLCARLPYGVKCSCTWSHEVPNGTTGCVQELSTFLIDEIEIMDNPEYNCQICDVKPYLRPMSSMTEEERKEFDKFIGGENTNWHLFDENRIAHCKSFYSVFCYFSTMGTIIDFFNLHHLDYHGLIEKNLAIKAPEEIYKTE